MKFHFELNLDYQLQTIEAVCGLFLGRETGRTEFTVTREPNSYSKGNRTMPDDRAWNEKLIKKNVTYHIEFDGRLLLIESVPVRVNIETGEKHFSPETVERLQQAVWERCRPVRTIETPVYEYAALS